MHPVTPIIVLIIISFTIPSIPAQQTNETVCYVLEEAAGDKPVTLAQALPGECFVTPARLAAVLVSHNSSHTTLRINFDASSDHPTKSNSDVRLIMKLSPASTRAVFSALIKVFTSGPFAYQMQAYQMVNSHTTGIPRKIGTVTPISNMTCGREGNIVVMEYSIRLTSLVLYDETYDLRSEEFTLEMAKVSVAGPNGVEVRKTATMGPKKLFDSRVVSRNSGGKDVCKSGSVRLVSGQFVTAVLLAVAVMLMGAF